LQRSRKQIKAKRKGEKQKKDERKKRDEGGKGKKTGSLNKGGWRKEKSQMAPRPTAKRKSGDPTDREWKTSEEKGEGGGGRIRCDRDRRVRRGGEPMCTSSQVQTDAVVIGKVQDKKRTRPRAGGKTSQKGKKNDKLGGDRASNQLKADL